MVSSAGVKVEVIIRSQPTSVADCPPEPCRAIKLGKAQGVSFFKREGEEFFKLEGIRQENH